MFVGAYVTPLNCRMDIWQLSWKSENVSNVRWCPFFCLILYLNEINEYDNVMISNEGNLTIRGTKMIKGNGGKSREYANGE